MKIGLLTNPNPIFGNQLIEYFKSENITFDLIIVDLKSTTARDIEIHNKRTNFKYPVKEIYGLNSKKENMVFVDNHNNLDTVNLIKNKKLDFLVNGATPRILQNEILKSSSIGILNCHPGILPFFRGCMAVEWSIFHEKPVGNTVHWMSNGIDEGAILENKTTLITPDMSYEDIRVKVQLDGLKLLANVVKKISENKINYEGKPQIDGSYYKPMSDEEFKIVLKKIKNGKYRNE